MRIRIAHDVLAEAAGWAAHALSGRAAAPVLAGLRLDAADGRLDVSGYDYELSAAFRAPAEIAAPGSVLVPGRLLAAISRTLPAGEAELRADGQEVVLACGVAEFALPALPLHEYPALPELPTARGQVDGAGFAAAVAQVAVVAGRDAALPVLTGVRIEWEPGLLRLVATDRYRLAVKELPWEGAVPGAGSALVPARRLLEIARALGREEGPVSVAVPDEGEAGLIGFAAGGRSATTRLLGGAFISYRRIFPAAYAGSAVVDRTPLLAAVKRVGLVAEHGVPLRLTLAGGRLAVDAGGGGEARSSESLPAQYGGDGIRLSANPGYLSDALGAITADRVELHYTTPTRPAVLSGAGDASYRYLFMPLRPA